MYVIIVIGGAQQGKSPYIKHYAENCNLLVNDVQNEYGEKVKYPGQKPYLLTTDNKSSRSRYIGADVDKFIELCKTKKNTICVFEEATMFFEGKTSKEMRRLLFGKAHTGNVYVLVFHSINAVPPRMMESSNYVVLFKTNDEEKVVERKYSKLLPYFKELQGKKDGTHFKIKVI